MSANVVRTFLAALAFSLAGSGGDTVAAQAAPRQEADPFAAVLFPPELIMEHARAIRLSDEQRGTITRYIEQTQSRAVRLQWQLAEQVRALRETLAKTRVEQDRAIDQLHRVLGTEQEIKQAHLEMLIRIKNVLRPEQQAELTRLRGAAEARNQPERQEQS